MAGLLLLAAVLLAGTLVLAGSTLQQTHQLDANVQVTTDIINANVRTLAQVQRELLRLERVVGNPQGTAADLERYRAFVSQRVQEGSLSYQVKTLGTKALLAQSRALAERWTTKVEPDVRALHASLVRGAADKALAQQLLSELDSLERGYNDLVSAGEINRKTMAGEANTATVELLGSTRLLVAGLAGTFTGLVVLVACAAVLYRRFDRQRETSRRRLVELDSETRTLSEVASRTNNMVIVTDAHGRVEWVNDAFQRGTGYTLAELVGKAPGHLLQGPGTDPETVAMMRDRLTRGEGFTCEILNFAKDGAPLWLALEVCPVHDEDGRLTHFIAVESDITQARASAELLRKAKEAAEEVAEQKAQFLATMSHEIRTPLNAVLGLTDLLLGTELTPTQREYVRTAHNSGTLLLSTLSNILSFSAAESGAVDLEQQPFPLRTLVERCTSLLAAQADGKGLTLELSVDPSLPERVVGDEVRLQQVLVNLIGNAVKFTDAGSVRVDVRQAGDGGAVCFEVADTGVGVPAEFQARIFEPFSQVDASATRRFGGSGLGLVISQRLVGLMGGRIELTSRPGEGARFSFTIPLGAATDEDPAQVPSAEPPSARARLRVLLAEDDAVNHMVARGMLERLGHECSVVADGQEAVEVLALRDFDVVLMDVQMPRLDGLSATRELRARGGAQPYVVALTANALDGDRERFLTAGMDDYLSKPFRLDALDEVLRRVPHAAQ